MKAYGFHGDPNFTAAQAAISLIYIQAFKVCGIKELAERNTEAVADQLDR